MAIPELLTQSLSDRYRIDREIGRGGMATVYLAQDLKHQRPVAIKVLFPELGAAIGPRFLREIEVVARLNHPHVIPLFDSGRVGEYVYYVMPYIQGASLRARLEREPKLPLDEAVRLTREIASALAHAHQHGLVHRDLKPENILLADGIALLADFGIARGTVDADAGETTQLVTGIGTILGTPQYMSPEQASGGEVDARTDLYALACVLYEMLAGRPPFVADSAGELLRMHLVAEPRPITEFRPEVPPVIALLLGRGLAKRPADRVPSAARFTETLTVAMAGPTSSSPTLAGPNNLPKPRTRFIGREKEVEELTRLFKETRLLTVTGIGGAGKTRLALQAAARVIERFPRGVWFTDLAPLLEGTLVAEAVAAPLDIHEVPGKTWTELLVERLRGQRMLFVLDNCEHVLAASAALADALLAASEEVCILATSREGLGVEGERQIALRSLATPVEQASHDRHAVEASEAVTLFMDRARIVSPEFSLTESNAPIIAEICRRLDGIPLAIELAAARVKMLSVDQIRDRLDDRFRLLVGGSKSALARHQTLRAILDWSYDQLAPEEQQLFRALAVFVGGWTLESATHLLGDVVDDMDTLDRLGRLIDKSLVIVDRDRSEEPRYHFLDTVRQYAEERLAEHGESADMRGRHFEVFLQLAERAQEQRFVQEETWGARLELEHDNVRAALELARGSDPEGYLRLVGALAWFFQARSHFIEGREHLTRAVAGSAAEPPRSARARALWGIANTLTWQGEGSAALPWMQDALETWRALGDRREIALALEGIGWAHLLGGEDALACTTFEESLSLFRELEDRVLVNRAMAALAQTLVALHRVEEARPMAKEIVAFSSARDDKRNEHSGWHYLADCALIEGNCAESLRLYRHSLILARAIGDRLETSFEIQGVGMSLAGLGEAERALRLAAAVNAEWARLGVDPHMRFWDELQDVYFGRAREALGPEKANQAWEAGKNMSLEAAIEDARHDPAT
jgi:non-specific serine/threonine protein kinase